MNINPLCVDSWWRCISLSSWITFSFIVIEIWGYYFHDGCYFVIHCTCKLQVIYGLPFWYNVKCNFDKFPVININMIFKKVFFILKKNFKKKYLKNKYHYNFNFIHFIFSIEYRVKKCSKLQYIYYALIIFIHLQIATQSTFDMINSSQIWTDKNFKQNLNKI